MRLFVAIWPPETALAELEAAVAPLRDRSRTLRWTAPEQWHLTLAFLGEVDDERRADLGQRLGRTARRHPPATLRLARGGRFGDRVLFAKVVGDTDEVRRLAASVSAAARRARITVDERPYRAHVTLARGDSRRGSRGGDSPAEPLSVLAGLLDGFEGTSWHADRLHLVRSRLGQGAGRRAAYETVASWRLEGRPATDGPGPDAPNGAGQGG
jgi:2'-5' RNA ligase